MSYARWGEGDVYVFDSVDGGFVCMECCLRERDATGWSGDYKTTLRSEMIEHLEAHKRAGHVVPESAIKRLRAEIERSGDEWLPGGVDCGS